jgi:hypothetical protein
MHVRRGRCDTASRCHQTVIHTRLPSVGFTPGTETLRPVVSFGGDPGVPVIQNGKETFPLVPVAVDLYSTAFDIFITPLLFPFIGAFDRVLSRIGHSAADDFEDYSLPRDVRLLRPFEVGRGSTVSGSPRASDFPTAEFGRADAPTGTPIDSEPSI